MSELAQTSVDSVEVSTSFLKSLGKPLGVCQVINLDSRQQLSKYADGLIDKRLEEGWILPVFSAPSPGGIALVRVCTRGQLFLCLFYSLVGLIKQDSLAFRTGVLGACRFVRSLESWSPKYGIQTLHSLGRS